MIQTGSQGVHWMIFCRKCLFTLGKEVEMEGKSQTAMIYPFILSIGLYRCVCISAKLCFHSLQVCWKNMELPAITRLYYVCR